jgi:hypothetical protein
MNNILEMRDYTSFLFVSIFLAMVLVTNWSFNAFAGC